MTPPLLDEARAMTATGFAKLHGVAVIHDPEIGAVVTVGDHEYRWRAGGTIFRGWHDCSVMPLKREVPWVYAVKRRYPPGAKVGSA